jgi:hypothetical protein
VQYEPEGKLLGQRPIRELLSHLEDRADLSPGQDHEKALWNKAFGVLKI